MLEFIKSKKSYGIAILVGVVLGGLMRLTADDVAQQPSTIVALDNQGNKTLEIPIKDGLFNGKAIMRPVIDLQGHRKGDSRYVEVNYVDGLIDGKVTWHVNDSTSDVGTYEKGLRVGNVVAETLTYRTEGQYSEGKPVGKWNLYHKGTRPGEKTTLEGFIDFDQNQAHFNPNIIKLKPVYDR